MVKHTRKFYVVDVGRCVKRSLGYMMWIVLRVQNLPGTFHAFRQDACAKRGMETPDMSSDLWKCPQCMEI